MEGRNVIKKNKILQEKKETNVDTDSRDRVCKKTVCSGKSLFSQLESEFPPGSPISQL